MIKGMNHVGISVSSLERSIRFYRELLGMEIVGQNAFDGGRYATILALEATTGTVATLQRGNIRLELFEFSHPQPKPGDLSRPVCDHGITHFCIEVADLELEYQRMRGLGVMFHCPPQHFPGAGKATYGRDPDGNVFELYEAEA